MIAKLVQMCCIHYRDDVFIIGGWKNSDDIDKQYRKEAYRYCAERKRWMLLPPMPQPRLETELHLLRPASREELQCLSSASSAPPSKGNSKSAAPPPQPCSLGKEL